MTADGSACSIGFGTGLDVYRGEPGSIRGLHLVVEDIEAARAELPLSRLLDMSVSQSSSLMPLHSTHDFQPC